MRSCGPCNRPAAKGMTRTTIRDYFGRHQSGDRIGAALALLMTKGLARAEQQESGGRPVEIVVRHQWWPPWVSTSTSSRPRSSTDAAT